MPEERRSYIVFRDDWLVVHTKPMTWNEAWWLYYAYRGTYVRDRRLRARYLEEWGSVLDAEDYVRQLRQLDVYLPGVYEDPWKFEAKVELAVARENPPPEARRAARELAARVGELYRRPVETRPLDPRAVMYVERPGSYVARETGGGARAAPEAEWQAYVVGFLFAYGVSVFRDSFWLWEEGGGVRAVAVRRDAGDEEVIDAVARDGLVLWFLGRTAEHFRDVISRREAEMKRRGYEDVVRRAKVILAAAGLLTAGRSEEEEGVPA